MIPNDPARLLSPTERHLASQLAALSRAWGELHHAIDGARRVDDKPGTVRLWNSARRAEVSMYLHSAAATLRDMAEVIEEGRVQMEPGTLVHVETLARRHAYDAARIGDAFLDRDADD